MRPFWIASEMGCSPSCQWHVIMSTAGGGAPGAAAGADILDSDIVLPRTLRIKWECTRCVNFPNVLGRYCGAGRGCANRKLMLMRKAANHIESGALSSISKHQPIQQQLCNQSTAQPAPNIHATFTFSTHNHRIFWPYSMHKHRICWPT